MKDITGSRELQAISVAPAPANQYHARRKPADLPVGSSDKVSTELRRRDPEYVCARIVRPDTTAGQDRSELGSVGAGTASVALFGDSRSQSHE